MIRHFGMSPWNRAIPRAVLLATLVACSKPPQENEGKVAATEPAATATPTPTPAPTVPAPAPSAPPMDEAPTPAETPVPPPSPATTAVAPPVSTPAETPDPLKLMQEEEARRQEYEKRLVQLAADRDAARGLVARTERDLLALKNPYLARPALTPNESAAIQGLSGADRVKWAEARLADAMESLKSAQSAYDDAKANPPN